jgi:hypothetical protein
VPIIHTSRPKIPKVFIDNWESKLLLQFTCFRSKRTSRHFTPQFVALPLFQCAACIWCCDVSSRTDGQTDRHVKTEPQHSVEKSKNDAIMWNASRQRSTNYRKQWRVAGRRNKGSDDTRLTTGRHVRRTENRQRDYNACCQHWKLKICRCMDAQQNTGRTKTQDPAPTPSADCPVSDETLAA